MLEFIPLREEELCLALPEDHPCAKAFQEQGVDLLQLREEFPVISSKICIDRLGNYISPTEALTHSEMVREYQLLQYNNLFDSKNRNELFFYGYETSQEQ